MLYVSPHPNATVRLDRCSGERYDNGDFIPCSGGCEAHFDANTENEYGEFYNPYPNSILSWVHLLPGTESADELIPTDHEMGVRPDWMTVHRNDTTFQDGDGRPVTAWVVSVHPGEPNWHFAAVFNSRKKAAGLVAEILADD